MKSTTEQLSNLQSSHTEYETKIAQLESELKQASSAEASANLSLTHDIDILRLQSQEDAANLAIVREDLEQSLAELKEAREKHHSSIAEMVSKHGEEKSQLKAQLENDHKVQVERLEADLEEAKAAAPTAGSTLSEQIEQLKKSHQDALEELQREHQQALQASSLEHETISKAEIAAIEKAHQELLKSMQDNHDRLLQETRAELIKVQSADSDVQRQLEEERIKLREELDASMQQVKSQLEAAIQERDALKARIEGLEQSRGESDERLQREKEVSSPSFSRAWLLYIMKADTDFGFLMQGLEKKHADEIAALQAKHEEKYANLLNEAKKESDNLHSAELAKLKGETEKAVEQLKVVHAVEIQSVHESGESIISTIKG